MEVLAQELQHLSLKKRKVHLLRIRGKGGVENLGDILKSIYEWGKGLLRIKTDLSLHHSKSGRDSVSLNQARLLRNTMCTTVLSSVPILSNFYTLYLGVEKTFGGDFLVGLLNRIGTQNWYSCLD